MAWRDSRASRRRLLVFSLSIALGVAALVGLGSLAAILSEAVRTQSKSLLGADLVVVSHAPLIPAVQAYLDSLGGERARQVSLSSMMVFPGASHATRLVQVKAMEGNFPFYGDLVTDPPAAAAGWSGLKEELPVILEDTLINQFDLKVGDPVKLGRATFRVAGALKKLPGESLAVAMLAPRALIPLPALARAGLADRQSLASYRVALKLPPKEDPDAIVRRMKDTFRAQRLSFDTVSARRRELGRTLSNVDGFLSLVGFIALLLGAIGVASAIHVYLRQKLATVAVLRCLGASASQAFAIYLVQGFALGAAGSACGGGLGLLFEFALPPLLKGFLPFSLRFSIEWAALGRGTAAGVVICVLFTLLPLLSIRRISPLRALRSAAVEGSSEEAERPGPRGDPWIYGLGIAIGIAVAAFAVWQAHSLRIGLGFAAGIAVCLGILGGLARGTAWAARRWVPWRLPYFVRQGVANLHRPKNRTVLVLMSLGLGTFLILTLVLTRLALLREIENAGGSDRPNLIFFDIQEDQIRPLERLLSSRGAPVAIDAAVVTMKITAVKGRPVEEMLRSRSGRIPSWTLRREYRSTFRPEIAGTERIVAGRFISRVPPGTAVVPISIEQSLAEDMRLGLGDEIDWDVQGVPLHSRLASIRAVEWRRLEPNFFVVFPLGVLEDAPKFYVAAVRVRTPAASADLQRRVVAAFPSITAIDLTLVEETLDDIFKQVEFILGFMALFTVGTGLIVLATAVVNGQYQRRRENALLRTLGATRRQLAHIQFVEHLVLGFLAALVGALLAQAAAALLARALFEVPPAFSAGALLAAAGIVAATTLLTGWAADRASGALSPLEVLRAEEG